MISFWIDIDRFDGEYQISNTGEVKSTKSHKILKTFDSMGYPKVCLSKNGKVTKHFVHRLVAKHFIPNEDNLPSVNHKDGDRYNNNISNLEWSSWKEQGLHKNRVINTRKRGVFSNNNGKTWYARIQINGKYKYLGSFNNKKSAYNKFYTEYIKIHGVKPW